MLKCEHCGKSDNTIRNVEADTTKWKWLCRGCILRGL